MPWKENDIVFLNNSVVEYRIENVNGDLVNLTSVLNSNHFQKLNSINGNHLHRVCVCRCCQKHYSESKSRADYKGYCSAACMHKKARQLGYRKNGQIAGPATEYSTLKRHKQIGSVYPEYTFES